MRTKEEKKGETMEGWTVDKRILRMGLTSVIRQRANQPEQLRVSGTPESGRCSTVGSLVKEANSQSDAEPAC